jgi:hypothetical protein
MPWRSAVGAGDVVFPGLGRRLQRNLDLAEFTDVISVMKGGRALSVASTFRQL